MPTNFDKFLKELDKESKECLENINKKIKGCGESIQESLMRPKSEQGTPVITKHLRSNWVVTTDTEWLGVSGSRENPDDSLQQTNWYKFLSKDDLYLSDNIYWNNNVYYGPWVNYGVDQPAQYFREKAIQDGNEYLKMNRK